MKAIPFPTSRALPPPKAITPSHLFSLYNSTPSVIFFPNGLPEKFEKTLIFLNFFFKLSKTFEVIGNVIKSLSVTNSGLLILANEQAFVISNDLSSPVQTVVG